MPTKRTSKLQEKPSAIKENIQHFETWNFLTFFYCLWVFFALLDPDRADQNQCWSGSATLPVRLVVYVFNWLCRWSWSECWASPCPAMPASPLRPLQVSPYMYRFCHSSFCEWVLMWWGHFLLGCYVMGPFVMGPLVMGPYVGAPAFQ